MIIEFDGIVSTVATALYYFKERFMGQWMHVVVNTNDKTAFAQSGCDSFTLDYVGVMNLVPDLNREIVFRLANGYMVSFISPCNFIVREAA